MSSRSEKDRYLPDAGASSIGDIPPACRNQRDPTGPDTPHATAASSLVSPRAICTQNARSRSRRTGGRPGDSITARPVNAAAQPGGRPIESTSIVEVLRPPVEPGLSRGIHPAILSRGGLGHAIKALARRSAVPTSTNINIGRRLAESVETAAYYFVAEAQTNTTKHARASTVHVSASISEGHLHVLASDNGGGRTRRRLGTDRAQGPNRIRIGQANRIEPPRPRNHPDGNDSDQLTTTPTMQPTSASIHR
jgi:hypothetical protein